MHIVAYSDPGIQSDSVHIAPLERNTEKASGMRKAHVPAFTSGLASKSLDTRALGIQFRHWRYRGV